MDDNQGYSRTSSVGTIIDYKVRATEGVFALVEWDYGERHLVKETDLEKVI